MINAAVEVDPYLPTRLRGSNRAAGGRTRGRCLGRLRSSGRCRGCGWSAAAGAAAGALAVVLVGALAGAAMVFDAAGVLASVAAALLFLLFFDVVAVVSVEAGAEDAVAGVEAAGVLASVAAALLFLLFFEVVAVESVPAAVWSVAAALSALFLLLFFLDVVVVSPVAAVWSAAPLSALFFSSALFRRSGRSVGRRCGLISGSGESVVAFFFFDFLVVKSYPGSSDPCWSPAPKPGRHYREPNSKQVPAIQAILRRVLS